MPESVARSSRKTLKISIDRQLVEDAEALSIDISRAAETGIANAIAAEKTRQWQEENKDAIESCNGYVRQYGLPLAKYRLF
ncbi:post-segregation antitoxin CcdA [Mesorhizobium tamadayense]|uniref:Post-segregation antitoxin CcdA n=1 Tax=Mesorhizobium tamadayense TaxID=425306 RepID=A0A3P3F7F7_9HYPH|nr:type II toxin-antitoxin system CcdA family antitoxin [Mesorhizobium tamadayense]RRH94357.1 post-segregation antitoxin CcdA [Mesorhizobium tamadayense]